MNVQIMELDREQKAEHAQIKSYHELLDTSYVLYFDLNKCICVIRKLFVTQPNPLEAKAINTRSHRCPVFIVEEQLYGPKGPFSGGIQPRAV